MTEWHADDYNRQSGLQQMMARGLPEPEEPAWWIVAGQDPGLAKWALG